MGHPTIYPTGVTVYDPERSWNGFTIFQAQEVGAVLMDMNGREVNVWKGVHGMPNKIFPGGYLLTSRGRRSGKYSVQDGLDVIQVDWDGNIVWKFDRNEFIDDPGIPGRWMARYHHDFQPEGMGDWMHINSMSVLGPNRWYDAGDERFHPDNIIVDGREANIIFIISKATGKITWKLGPDYDNSPEAKAIGWIIGQHHAHMIPHTLPGGGNILVFDNGGWGGYDVPNPGAPTGVKAALRDYSRVLEIDPVAMKIVWQYTPTEAGFLAPMDSNRFYSPFISGMQRLPNGNTLITEGSDGRVFEVTPDHKIVWEFVSPYKGKFVPMNMTYRAYRVPYEWVPQVAKPVETAIEPLDVATFRVPGAAAFGDRAKEVSVEGCVPYEGSNALCVASVEDPEDK